MKGFKIRIPVMPIESSRFESLGAAPITINIKEAYSALQTRLVDGQDVNKHPSGPSSEYGASCCKCLLKFVRGGVPIGADRDPTPNDFTLA